MKLSELAKVKKTDKKGDESSSELESLNEEDLDDMSENLEQSLGRSSRPVESMVSPSQRSRSQVARTNRIEFSMDPILPCDANSENYQECSSVDSNGKPLTHKTIDSDYDGETVDPRDLTKIPQSDGTVKTVRKYRWKYRPQKSELEAARKAIGYTKTDGLRIRYGGQFSRQLYRKVSNLCINSLI